VILTDPDGTGTGLGVVETGEDSTSPQLDRIGAGTIHVAPPGRGVEIVNPPRVDDYGPYSEVTLRTVAAGFGVTYEGMTGDYSEMPFSAARMSRLAYWARVEDWRWQTLIPQFCQPVWFWAMQVAVIAGRTREIPTAEWTAPPPPMIDPKAEGLAYRNNVRTGIMSLSEALRERGYNPKIVLQELAADFKLLDKLELVLDCDPRKRTQQGQSQSEPKEEEPEPPVTALAPAKKSNGKATPANGATK
jgi:capsid protein